MPLMRVQRRAWGHLRADCQRNVRRYELPSPTQRRREIDSGAHAEVFRRPFGIVIIPRFSLSLFFAGKVADVLAGIFEAVEMFDFDCSG